MGGGQDHSGSISESGQRGSSRKERRKCNRRIGVSILTARWIGRGREDLLVKKALCKSALSQQGYRAAFCPGARAYGANEREHTAVWRVSMETQGR